MASEFPEITLKPIGFVRNKVKEAGSRGSHKWEQIVSEIVVDASLSEALDGLEEFSHIVVLYWMHRLAEDKLPLKIHPMRNEELPLTGLFATRAPMRPNPIGQTAVRLLERRGNNLKVKGLDALDGSPVIDIKPYLPHSDFVADSKVPKWVTDR